MALMLYKAMDERGKLSTGRMEAARTAWNKAFTYGPDNPAIQAFRARMQNR